MSEADASRTPTEPYPGLRPFLDNEEILLFGRERQVREVIERLRQTQFVAVIGGSGSGKSSLILAGVVPELRSFGIPGAGDYWVPMVCTPGTNASLADQAQRAEHADHAAGAQVRGAAALARFARAGRRAAGGDRRAAARGAGLFEPGRRCTPTSSAVPPGPKPQDARFLFVIDQFEELFHPTTRHVDDARLLVERVIDHFFSPHPRCYVVLTMRSEHLNDCACFLELPDAINKASYLVRRLDDAEMRDAIIGPAERLLRLRAAGRRRRGAAAARRCSSAPSVTARLLKDVRAISDDPDHLPLLQHVLARIWQAAVHARGAAPATCPIASKPGDLAVAVSALPAALAPPLGDDLNVLRTSLERWAEAAYQRHGEAQRARARRACCASWPSRTRTPACIPSSVSTSTTASHLLGAQATRADLKALLGQRLPRRGRLPVLGRR